MAKYICFLVFVFSSLAWSAGDEGIDVIEEPPLLNMEIMAEIFCRDSEAPKSYKFENIETEILSCMLRMNKGIEYPILIDVEGHQFPVTRAAVIETFCAEYDDPEECKRGLIIGPMLLFALTPQVADIETYCAESDDPEECKRESVIGPNSFPLTRAAVIETFCAKKFEISEECKRDLGFAESDYSYYLQANVELVLSMCVYKDIRTCKSGAASIAKDHLYKLWLDTRWTRSLSTLYRELMVIRLEISF